MKIHIPEKLLPVIESKHRYIILYGGRSSAKSWTANQLALAKAKSSTLRILCAREIQKSIKQSIKQSLDDTIERCSQQAYFKSTDHEIRGLHNNSKIIFSGLWANIDNIKSMEGIDLCIVEEADKISQKSLDVLLPTIRKPGSQIWFIFNPEEESSPVYQRFVMNEDPDALVIKVNYWDNPWFSEESEKNMLWDKSHDMDKYLWIWEGNCRRVSDAQVFKGKWTVDTFESPSEIEQTFYMGADWGFSTDPNVLVRCWVNEEERRIYIDHEAYGVGVELKDIAKLFSVVPLSEKWPITADNARPETISYLKNEHGMNVLSSKKGKGSIEDGVEFIKSYETVIHPRCKHTIDEFTLYSYKQDKITNEILPVLIDKNNHIIDALRYALERYRKSPRNFDVGSLGQTASSQGDW